MFIRTINTLLISMLFVLCMAQMLYAENVPGLNVSYDQKEDLLTVDANGVPLTHILAQISEQSGVDILVDPSIEKDISIYLPAQSLEKALKQLARGLNYAMHYDKAASRLVAMKIVPQGKQGGGNLVSVTKPNKRAGRSNRNKNGNYGTSGSGSYSSGRKNSVGDASEIRNKQKPPAANRQNTLSPGEMAAQGNNAPPNHDKSLPAQQNDRGTNGTQSSMQKLN